MQLKNDLVLQAAVGKQTPRTPVWLMRQAGRILPEYRKIREKLSGFKELVKTPELAAAVTLQPVDRLGVDAAIIFSDILVVSEAMGLSYEMIEGKGPYLPKKIESKQDLNKINVINGSELDYVYEAIGITKKNLGGSVPLIGFAGAPWTLMAYMVEGSGSKTFSKARGLLYTQPRLAESLLDKITNSTIIYLKRQVEAGADILQIFDSWAGVLCLDQYRDFSLRYISKICKAITEVPVTVFSKGAYSALKDLRQLDCQTIGLDWNMDIDFAKKLFTDKTLQGNLDPCALYGSEDKIRQETIRMLKSFGNHPHIANLGHGVYPDTDLGKVKFFIETVKESSQNRKVSK